MKTEKTLTIFFLLGLILKTFNVTGSSILLVTSVGILSLLYMPFAFYFFSDKKIKNQNIVLSVVGGAILSLTVLGILFKLMFWPGALTQLTLGIYLLPILLIITFALSKKADEGLKKYYKEYLLRNIFWTILCILFYFLSNNQLLQIQYRNDPELLELKIKSYKNPNNEEYQNDIENYYIRKDSIEYVQGF